MLNSIKNPPRLIACIISFLFGAIGTLSFSPFDYWIMAFVSAFGLIWSATLSQRKPHCGQLLLGRLVILALA